MPKWLRTATIVFGIFAAWFVLGVVMFDYIPEIKMRSH